MGQKVNPNGLRVAVNKDWRSRWFAGKKEFGDLLHEDIEIRKMVKTRLKDAAVPEVIIERYANRARITVFTARPGIVIGRKGQDIEKLKEEIAKKTGKEVYVEIREVKDPDTTAQLVAENIAVQLERRVSFRRALKRAVQLAMDLGALGIKVRVSGRLGGAELARTEGYKEGKVPLHTLRANIQYGFTEAHTVAGKIGVKVWICRKQEEPVLKEQSHATYA
ncbi:MAG TPA: 30S ribosomal protein S3 [Kiritimatiellia bacterium]|nr:30S ribosomal protein S3 [Kiritimatiellia bacterium]HMO98828.1 30S ribosomal protein S3 [Kiritimatiellia bacterium]HMP96224.1 30S ribosomal protein S3 [Kiritimatiellia bacterium]